MPIENIEKISKALKKTVDASEEIKTDHFEALMNQGVKNDATVTNTNQIPKDATPSVEGVKEIVQKVNPTSFPSEHDLAVQTKNVIAQIDTLKEKLQTPNLELKNSVKQIMRNKLEHINESLNIALQKAGGEQIPMEKPNGLMTPIDRFLGLLTHGQNQLESIYGDIVKMQGPNDQLTPANMLLVQIKVAHISQEIALFSNMLNQVLSSAKTIMNVQV